MPVYRMLPTRVDDQSLHSVLAHKQRRHRLHCRQRVAPALEKLVEEPGQLGQPAAAISLAPCSSQQL